VSDLRKAQEMVVEIIFYPDCTILVFDDEHEEVIELKNQIREPEPGEEN
jgi:hypothetical protein